MKKSVLVLLVIGLLATTSFIIAQGCGGRSDEYGEIHGVEIDGECYDCGADDGICPEDFGVSQEDCTNEGARPRDPDCLGPVTEEAFWSEDGDTAILTEPFEVDMFGSTTIHMVVTNTGLPEDTTVYFTIEESDGLLDDGDLIDDALGTFEGIVVAGGKAIGNMTINDSDDLGPDSEGIYELLFNAEDAGETWSNSASIDINWTDLGGGPSPGSCDWYNDNGGESACNEDAYGTSRPSPECARDPVGTCTYACDSNCTWNINTSICENLEWEYLEPGNETPCDVSDVICSYVEVAGAQIGDCAVDDSYKISYQDTSGQAECEDWISGPIPCAQRLQVPFFGFYSFISSMIAICLVYVFLIQKRKFIK